MNHEPFTDVEIYILDLLLPDWRMLKTSAVKQELERYKNISPSSYESIALEYEGVQRESWDSE